MTKEFVPGYHITPIEKGELGEISVKYKKKSTSCAMPTNSSQKLRNWWSFLTWSALSAYTLASITPTPHCKTIIMADITARAFENGRYEWGVPRSIYRC